MQRNQPTLPRPSPPRRALGAGMLLFLYCVTATSLAPAVIALLAEMDRSHQVGLQHSTHGLQVVLHHEVLNSPRHRHGMVARALTVFAQRPTAQHPDHVLQFGGIDTTQQPPALAMEPASNPVAADEHLAGAGPFLAPEVTVELAAWPRPPPAPSGLLLNVRSTVLLI